MRVLYVDYALWKQITQDRSYVVYDKQLVSTVGSEQAKAWSGALDLVYATDIGPSDWSDYTTAFPTRTTVGDEDEAVARIVGLSGTIQPRSVDGTLQTSKQQLELGRAPFRRTDTQSELMNVNGIAAGTPVNVWNGTGAGDTGADWTRTGVGSEHGPANHTPGGTYGLNSGATSQNDTIVFDYGSMQDIAGTVDELGFWLQLKALVAGGNLRVFWVDGSNSQVGGSVLVSSYLSNFDLDEWKKVAIPISDFSLTGNVQKLVLRFINASGLHIWLDDVSVTPSAGGGPHIYRISAPTGFIYHVERLALIVSAGDTGWGSTSFANIVGGLTSGLAFRYRMLGGDTYWAFNCRDNSELFGQLQVINDVSFSNGDRQFTFALEPRLSSVVLVDDDEVVEIIVRDDLSSLVTMRAFLHYGTEVIPS